MPAASSLSLIRFSITWPAEPSCADHFGLAHERIEHNVGFALLVAEVAAEDLLGRLQLAVDAAVALLQARRIPRQIEMNEIGAVGLQVDAFARRIGADEDAQRLLVRIGIEGALHLLAAILRRSHR